MQPFFPVSHRKEKFKKKLKDMPIQIVNFTHLDAHIRLHAGGGRTASMVVEGKEKSPVELDNSVIPNSITWWNENESEQQRFDIGSTARYIIRPSQKHHHHTHTHIHTHI